jgi:CHAT domain-containing protein
MRGLRSSIDQLRASDSELADKLTAINRDLEALTLTFAQSNYGDEEGGIEGMDPFSRLVLRQRGLLDDRDKLISQIRTRKGFESFLKPPSFDNLRSAAERGPVIIINHNKWRSDIIILLHDTPPSLIPTADDFYDRANELRDQLLGARESEEGPSAAEYEDALCSVLKELYELVGRPVIQRLNELHVPEQSRIWWCPTSAFCSLPLHAMGPISPESDPPRYFLDLYIPSYTPTLSALIESNKSESQALGKPSLLLVVLPDASMKDALAETRVVQSVDTQVKSLIAARAKPTAVLKHLQDHQFLHIVCHGILEPGKPFDSSFKLYDKKRLTLLDIIRSRLPNAEFAFLAACHTAELTDGSLSDEALHLTAAMQYCGFRSVVGTMWAMADKDGRRLSQNVYNSVFPSPPWESRGTSYYERTAEALRDAVIILRERTAEMTLERWVNFVHYGA